MKKTLKFTVPLWVILLITIILIAGICIWVSLAQRNPDQELLSSLSTDNVQSVTYRYVLMGDQGYKKLNEEQTRELISLLSQVELPGEPWNLHFIGYTSAYIIQTKDGHAFDFWLPAHYYGIDTRTYYLCEYDEEPPELYQQLDALMEKHRKELWPDDPMS